MTGCMWKFQTKRKERPEGKQRGDFLEHKNIWCICASSLLAPPHSCFPFYWGRELRAYKSLCQLACDQIPPVESSGGRLPQQAEAIFPTLVASLLVQRQQPGSGESLGSTSSCGKQSLQQLQEQSGFGNDKNVVDAFYSMSLSSTIVVV